MAEIGVGITSGMLGPAPAEKVDHIFPCLVAPGTASKAHR